MSLAIVIGMSCMAPALAVAQSGRPPVEIDNSVLDQLGPPSNLPELFLRQNDIEPQKIVLVPPKGLKSAGKSSTRGLHLTVQDIEPAPITPAAIHLHPVKRHHVCARKLAKSVKTLPAAASMVAAKDSAPANLTPTLPQSAAPVVSENLPAPPPAKDKTPVTAPVPPPIVAPAPAQAPPAGAPQPLVAQPAQPLVAQPLVALTAQPPGSDTAAPNSAQESLATILFDKESARLPDGARDTLAHLASRMSEDATLEVQLLAYAAGDEENASKARRLSLSRAVAVRSFLIDQGVRRTRIEVRSLGNKVPDGAPDRVDIVVLKRG